MPNTVVNLKKYQARAFTLLETLLTLAITTFLVMLVSGGISSIYQQVQEQLFFTSFETLYRHSQKLSNAQQGQETLRISSTAVKTSKATVPLPETVSPAKDYTVDFSSSGGNSSLQKIQFRCEGKTITYQLYIGSGRYKKSIS